VLRCVKFSAHRCRRSGVEPVPRERAEGLIQEWTEVLSGRPEPTQQ